MVDVCHKCTKPTRPNAKFCAACGTRLNADPNAPSSMSIWNLNEYNKCGNIQKRNHQEKNLFHKMITILTFIITLS